MNPPHTHKTIYKTTLPSDIIRLITSFASIDIKEVHQKKAIKLTTVRYKCLYCNKFCTRKNMGSIGKPKYVSSEFKARLISYGIKHQHQTLEVCKKCSDKYPVFKYTQNIDEALFKEYTDRIGYIPITIKREDIIRKKNLNNQFCQYSYDIKHTDMVCSNILYNIRLNNRTFNKSNHIHHRRTF